MTRLAVGTLNVWNKSGPWQERLPLIRRELAALAPDMLGLQEVLRLGSAAGPGSADADQVSEIADGFGYEIAYGAAAELAGGLFFGNALLSKHPIVESRNFPLPGSESGESRALLYALVRSPFGLVPFFVTHLNWKLHHGSVRSRQMAAIVDHIFELAPIDDARLPPILVGDMNADPDSDEIRFLRGLCALGGRTVYFADAWLYGGDGGPGYTFDRKNRFAALAREPPRRIDYVFVRGPDRLLRGEPLATRLAFATSAPSADGEIWPSDHFGIVAEISAAPRSL